MMFLFGGASAELAVPKPDVASPLMYRSGLEPQVHCPSECLDESTPWWYNASCKACARLIKSNRASTWTCPPTWPPQRMLAMFSMQRSASQTACYLIDSFPDTVCDGELFDPGHWKRPTGMPLDPNPVQAMRKAFNARISSSGKAPCTWVFKIFPEHVSQQPWLLNWLWKKVDAAIILERSNGEKHHAIDPPS